MATTEKYLKEAKKLTPKSELDNEGKLKFIDSQLDGFRREAYRFQVEIETAKRYIAVGESRNEDQYITTGQDKIQEAVGHLRSLVINIEVLERLRDELDQAAPISDNPTQ